MNRFELALQIYEKLNPNATIDGEDPQIQTGHLVDQAQSRVQSGARGLAAYIQSIQPIPYYSLLLGICQDGLPLLLDLEHYQSGPLLVTGSHTNSMRAFMNSVLSSGRLINPPELVDYILITPDSSAFENEIIPASHREILHPADRSAHELVMHLSSLVEQRNTGRQRGPTLILAIEDLDTLIRYMNQDVYAHFLWLLREGPFARVWPIATLHAGSRLFTDFKFESLFSTRILVSSGTSTAGSTSTTVNDHQRPFHQVITNSHTFDIALP
ncbi:MAG TPA: hypothetical protein VFZ76_15125 [Anaerolineales bacterium]